MSLLFVHLVFSSNSWKRLTGESAAEKKSQMAASVAELKAKSKFGRMFAKWFDKKYYFINLAPPAG